MAAGVLEATITSDAEAFWRWLAVNGSFILFAIYLASTACLIALALQTRSLSRRVAELGHSSEQRGRQIGELSKAIDAFAMSRAEQSKDQHEFAAVSDARETQSATIEMAEFCDDLRALMVEMASESGDELSDFRTK